MVRLKGEKGYSNDFGKWNYNVSKVDNIMRAHNCSKGGDGFYRCSGTKVSFDFASTIMCKWVRWMLKCTTRKSSRSTVAYSANLSA